MARLTPEQRLLRDTRAPLVGAVVAYVDDFAAYQIGRVTEVAAYPATGRVVLTLTDRAGGNAKHKTWTVEWSMGNFDMTIVPTLSEVPR